MIKPRFHLQRRLVEPRIQFVGQKFLDIPSIQIFNYDKRNVREFATKGDFSKIEEIVDEKSHEVTWINIHGIHDTELIRRIASKFFIDNLVIQDIVDTTQRPKIDIHPDFLYFSVKSILPSEQGNVESENISFVLKGNVLLSFQEKIGDHFEHIRGRIRENKGLVRKNGADFLLYLLLDAITGNCYSTLERMESELEELPSLIMKEPKPEYIVKLEDLKRNLFSIRKAIIPLKEAIVTTEKGQTEQIKNSTIPYFSDLKDQLLLLIDETDINLTRAEGSTNLFFSYQGHRMNEVMKVLTIVATIFIPLTFMAGIYGMNFQNMPELSWKYGYPMIWLAMILVAIVMVIYFRRKKWF
ncbi:magnesium/cobalt transporter CorA [Marinilabilia rubra]|uniref:Magnesium transport protein CorA n=1 Tax=Marinilabilia rubra TaxID=2162893 RepID=A0A2U2BCC5_9BACT|nr:magnesium/cobalt transporter CorA [Marinilabilia rubra]PWE00724.1 magnesium and cobalt transport protein CorA [Marinilabilia rubra]